MNRTSADRLARDLIQADQVSEQAVRAVVNAVPLALALEVMTSLAAYANKAPHEPRQTVPHDPGQPIPEHWTADELKRAHAAYERRHRDPWTVAGERIYQRDKKAAKRVPGTAPNGGRFLPLDQYPGRSPAMEIDGNACHACGVDQRDERRSA